MEGVRRKTVPHEEGGLLEELVLDFIEVQEREKECLYYEYRVESQRVRDLQTNFIKRNHNSPPSAQGERDIESSRSLRTDKVKRF